MSGMPQPMSVDEFDRLFQQVKNWGRWGPDDQHGALNLITPEKRRRAAALVSEGTVVSASLPLPKDPGPENPTPVMHLMLKAGDLPSATSSRDYVAMAPHGLSSTHLDALCHIFYRGQMYNGVPASKVTSAGALANSVEAAADGIVSRGVLLDIPRALGRPWLQPGEAIDVADLEATEAVQSVHVEEGDVLLVRTGRRRGMAEVADWDVSRIAGMHPACAPWMHERGVAVLGCDGASDIMPAIVEDGTLPMHTLCLPAMGVLLIDNCALDGLAETCERLGRWEFLFMMAPWRLAGGTASPVNPLAVF